MEYNKHLEDVIMTSWHAFLEDRDCKLQNQYLMDLTKKHKIKLESEDAVAIDVSFKGFSIENIKEEKALMIERMNRNCFILSSLFSLFHHILKDLTKEELSLIEKDLVLEINKWIIRDSNYHVSSLIEALDYLKEMRKLQVWAYEEFIKNDHFVSIGFGYVDLEQFIRKVKEMIHMSRFVALFIMKSDYSLEEMKVLNDFINARSTTNLVMKVAVRPNEWKTYHTSNGCIIQTPHDYSIIHMDEYRLNRKK